MTTATTFRRAHAGLVALALAALTRGPSAAVQIDERGGLKPPALTSVTCQIHPGGSTVHFIKGTFPGLKPAGANANDVPVTVEGDWDPVKKEATEIISWTGDIGIRPMPADNERWTRGRMSCPSDPWVNAVTCSLLTSELSYTKLSTGTFPVTERFLTPRIRAEVANACMHPIPVKQPKPTVDPRLLASNAQLPQPCSKVACVGPQYGATYSGGTPGTLKPGTLISIPVTVTNTGCLEWVSAGGAFHLSNHWYSGAQEITADGLRTPLPHRICPGETIQMMGSLQAPSTPGTYVLKWDMVQEGVAWFSTKGVATHDVTVTVK